jgi:hypothetical protein
MGTITSHSLLSTKENPQKSFGQGEELAHTGGTFTFLSEPLNAQILNPRNVRFGLRDPVSV